MNPEIDSSRRGLLMSGSAAAITATLGGPMAALATRVAEASVKRYGNSYGGMGMGMCMPAAASTWMDSPYGPTAPVTELVTGLPLIDLPTGFSCKATASAATR